MQPRRHVPLEHLYARARAVERAREHVGDVVILVAALVRRRPDGVDPERRIREQGRHVGARFREMKPQCARRPRKKVDRLEAKDWCTGAVISCDDKDTAWKVFGGYQFTPNFAAEIGYSKLGKFKASGTDPVTGIFQNDDTKVTAWEISALGAWPIMNQLSVFGRLGLYRATVKETNSVFGNLCGRVVVD